MKKMISLLLVMLGLLVYLCGCQQADAIHADETLASVEDTEKNSPKTDSSQSDPLSTQSSPVPSQSDSTPSQSDPNPSPNVTEPNHVPESLSEKLIREIDDAYKEDQKKPESSTTVGMVELAKQYAEKWKQAADEYYNKIMAYDGVVQLNENYASSDDLHTYVSNMKSNWEQYYQVQCENYLNTLKATYGAGTIVGPIMADYEYNMQMEWTLQLAGICQQLRIS